MPDQWEREEEDLYAQFERGEITQAALQAALRELHRDHRDEMLARAEDAADRAYHDEIDRW